MTILIGPLEFEGPYSDIDMLSDEAGIFALLCENAGEYELLEFGESEAVREQLNNHQERLDLLEDGFAVSFAVHYTPDLSAKERFDILRDLEHEFDDEAIACA